MLPAMPGRTSLLSRVQCLSRAFSVESRARREYNDTIDSLRLNEKSRVIYQGARLTRSQASLVKQYVSTLPAQLIAQRRQATANAKETIEYGTRVVGGVSPGKDGLFHLGLPVFGSVKQAVREVKPDVSAVFVPANASAKAILEAIEAEVPLVVAVAEHMPVHDLLRVNEVLRAQSATRLVGPNCPGVIAPAARCRVGIMPFRQYRGGRVGIVSKSGTLSYEAVGATSAAGLGQSLVIAVGGDSMPGTTIADALQVLFHDAQTEGIVVIGEIGGEAEIRAAESIAQHRRTASSPKPVVAMVAGRTAPRGKTMGHAGAVLGPLDATAGDKAKALEQSGAVIVPHPGLMGTTMKTLLEERNRPKV